MKMPTTPHELKAFIRAYCEAQIQAEVADRLPAEVARQMAPLHEGMQRIEDVLMQSAAERAPSPTDEPPPSPKAETQAAAPSPTDDTPTSPPDNE